MRIYVGFDDTDNLEADRGTGKLARWFEQVLPEGCRLWGVARQQLLVDPAIPYTSHNSSACAVVECADTSILRSLIGVAIEHIEAHSLPGSDPGLCVVSEGHPALAELTRFGLRCTNSIMTQKGALEAVDGAHLSGHGGTNDGIIGAAAAVGLTVHGWSGRLIEYGRLRDLPSVLSVGALEGVGIGVVSVDRDARVPAIEDIVDTTDWLRPRLIGGRPVLMVLAKGRNRWESIGKKHVKERVPEAHPNR